MADDDIPLIPVVPEALREAAQLGKLIPFVGAGASRLAGCPNWAELADGALRCFVAAGKFSYAQLAHALRQCRLSDKETGSHADAWARMTSRFDYEVSKCATGNYEFSTLAGAYIGNLDYIDGDWLRLNIPKLFPAERPANFTCALGGLAYSGATSRIYVLLRDAGVLDRALPLELTGRDVRKKLVERVVLGYLWGEDTLDSPRFSQLFAAGRVDDLEAASWFLWSIRGERLSADQVRWIGNFWERCVKWAQAQTVPPDKVLSSVAHLAWSLESASGRNLDLLLAVAPYVGAHHGTHEFLGELERLVESDPAGIAAVIGKLVETHQTYYDYQGRLKSVLARLAEVGQRAAALDYCNRFRNVSGIPELFAKLTTSV